LSLPRAALTGREATTKEDFLARFNGRLEALARNKEMLITGAQEGGRLRDLVVKELEIAAVAKPETLVSGEDFEVQAHEYWAVALCVHELITNSIKYGALAGGGTLFMQNQAKTPVDDALRPKRCKSMSVKIE